MRILFLSQRVPYPPNRGDRIVNYNVVRHLSQRHSVVIGCLSDGPADRDHIEALNRMGAEVVAVPLSRLGRRWRAMAALIAGREPLTRAYFREPDLVRRVHDLLATRSFDLAIVSSSGMASYVEIAALPRIIQFVDLDSQKWQAYADASAVPKSWLYREESRRLFEYELSVAGKFDRTLFCAERETREFQRLAPHADARTIRVGVDLDYFQPRQAARNTHQLIFTGVMDYRPNSEGADWFCRDVLPRVQAQIPEATMTICGASPNRTVRRLARLPGVVVTGAVPDVRPYLARSSVAVIPVRIARGVQNKLLEAMAMGLPAVTTTAAFGGLDADVREGVYVADQPQAFADRVIRLLQDDDERLAAGRAARAAVEANFRWSDSLAVLDDVIAGVMNRRRSSAATAVPVVAT